MSEEIHSKIRDLICPIIEKYELSMVDILMLCKHKISPDINRDIAIMAIRNAPMLKARFAPYYDMWRPHFTKRIERKEYINNLPRFMRLMIVAELKKLLDDDKLWKRHDVYHAMLVETRI